MVRPSRNLSNIRRYGTVQRQVAPSAADTDRLLAETADAWGWNRPQASARRLRAADGDGAAECATCSGTGRLKHPATGKPSVQCPSCQGTGFFTPGDDIAEAPPGAALDHYPWARSWTRFVGALRNPEHECHGVIARVMDETRIRNAGGLGERVPSEGGALVPERLRAECLAYMTDAIVRPRCQVVPMDSLRVPIPLLDNPSQASAAQALGGLTFSFVQEGQAIPATTPNFGRLTLEAWKFAAYMQGVPNELLGDSPAFTDVFLPQVIGRGLAFEEDEYFIAGTATGNGGTGVGQPQSLVNAPGGYVFSRTGGAGKVVLADLAGMYKSLHPASKMRSLTAGQTGAVWLLSTSAMDQLMEIYLSIATPPAGQDVTPPDWFQAGDGDGVGASILGVPAIVSEHHPAVGNAGDVILVDLSLYLMGVREEMTIEIASRGGGFGSDTSNVRIRTRIDGRYWPQSNITLANGQVTAPLVVLH